MRALGSYLLSSRLATGALGEAYLAGRPEEDADPLWVKVLRPELSSNLRFRRILQTEAPGGIAFAHPNAVPLLEIGQDGDDTFLVTPFVRGQSLSAVMRRARVEGPPLSQPLACWIILQVCRALSAAHKVPWFEGAPGPLVHGAVSPRSILVGYDGSVRLAGLGYGRSRATVAPAGPRLAYAAPEVLAGRDLVSRTDVYGVGVTLHDALSGRTVYRRPDEAATRAAVLAGNAAPVSPRNLTVRPEVGEAVQHMMAPRVDARAPDLAELEALLEVEAGDEVVRRAELQALLSDLFREEQQVQARQVGAAIRASGGTGDLPPSVSGDLAPALVPPAPVVVEVEEDVDLDIDVVEPLPTPEPVEDDPGPAVAVVPPDDDLDIEVVEEAIRSDDAPPPNPFVTAVLGRRSSSALPRPVSVGPAKPPAAPPPDDPKRPFLGLLSQAVDEGEFVDLGDLDEPPVDAPAVDAPPVDAPASSAAPEPVPAAAAPTAPVDGGAVAEADVPEAPPAPVSAPGVRANDGAPGSPEAVLPPPEPARPLIPRVPSSGGWAVPDPLARLGGDPGPAHASHRAPTPMDGTPVAFSDLPHPAAMPGELVAPNLPKVARYRLVHAVPTSQPRQRYLARDPSLSRDVWLDVITRRDASDPRLTPDGWVERFKLEARLLARVAHPMLPAVLDAGRDGERYFTARTPVSGAPLLDPEAPDAPMSAEVVARVVRDLAEALDALHQAELRAGGILVEDVWRDAEGRAVLADLPRLFPTGGPEHPLVATTLRVLPPEFMDGAPFGRSGDLFSLGLLAHRLLTGAEALPAESEARVEALRGGQIPVPRVEDPHLQDVLQRLLASAPAARFMSAREVVDTLGGAQALAAGAQEGRADVILVDPDVTPAHVRRILRERGVRAAVYPTVEAALVELPRLGARSLVVARSTRVDQAELQHRIAKLGQPVEVRFVPPAATRLVGPPLSMEGLAEAWITLAPRVLALGGPEPGFLPTIAARAMAAHMELGLRTELLAGLTAAARLLARRLGESPLKLAVHLPEEVPEVLEAVARIEAGTLPLKEARIVARLVAVADQFYQATRLDGVAPSRALEQMKGTFTCRAGRAVVEALVSHLRELYSTGDLAPPAADAPRVVLARRARTPSLVKMLEFDGLQVDEADDGVEAWELIRTLRPRVAVVDDRLSGRDGITLAELAQVHPGLAEVHFIVLGDPEDAELRARAAALGEAQLVDRAASVEALRARVGAVLSRAG